MDLILSIGDSKKVSVEDFKIWGSHLVLSFNHVTSGELFNLAEPLFVQLRGGTEASWVVMQSG